MRRSTRYESPFENAEVSALFKFMLVFGGFALLFIILPILIASALAP